MASCREELAQLLLARSSGHKRISRTLDWGGRPIAIAKRRAKMIRAETSVVINRPVEDIEAFLNDLQNQAQWVSGHIEVRSRTEGPLRPGYKYTDVRQMLGQRLEATVELMELVPKRRRSLKTTEGPISAKATFTFEPVEGGTRVNYTFEGEAKGVFKLADPVLARMIQRQVETDFSNLKDLLEA
jgi:carbon monoxide dehydrogenase subunit G